MGELFGTVKSYFTGNGWPVSEHDDVSALRLEYEGDHGRWYCYAEADEARDQFRFYSVLPDVVPEGRRQAVAELLTRANAALQLGNFEMVFDSGEVRFRTGIDVSGAALTEGLIDPLVRSSWVVVDQHLPALRAVVADELSPAAALEAVAGPGEVDLVL